MTATDTSPAALDVARANAERLGLGGRVRSRAAGRVPTARRFDLVLANLPYVAEGEWEGLAPEIRDYEPREALVAGPDGLEAIALHRARRPSPRCEPGASLALEVGAGQADAVAELVRDAGFRQVELRRDLAGIERVVIGGR